MIVDLILLTVILVMVAYMIRHYSFTFNALFREPQQRSYLRTSMVFEPKVSILIPSRNEEAVIGNLLQRLTETTYPKEKLQIIVIDDGSTDKTGEVADEFAEAYPYIKAIHRKDGGRGKPDTLNYGFRISNGEVILTFDSDYYPQKDIIEKLVAPFVDPEVGAVQGRVTVLNEEDSFVSKVVTLERIGGYRIDQLARDNLSLIPQYGGTVGGFRREVLEKNGGWDPTILAEDTDLTCETLLQGYQVRYVNDAECYEEAVQDWRSYWRQRYRWAKGHMQVAFKQLKKFWGSKQFSGLEKIEITMLLSLYLNPVFILVGWLIGFVAYFMGAIPYLWYYMGCLAVFTYSTVGNFAPFFEVGSAIYLDGRKELMWMLPTLTIGYTVMVFCCTKALLDLMIDQILRRREYEWEKTVHNGNGNHYVNNHINNNKVKKT